MILTTDEILPQLKAAHDDGGIISDDVAQTIASWWHSPAAVDEQITRVSHGKEFDADALCERLARIVASKVSDDQLPGLLAFEQWAESKTQHIVVKRWRATDDEYVAADGYFDDDDADVSVYRVAEYRDNLGEWAYPGSANYPPDTSGYEVEDDGSVWIPGGTVETAAHMLCGTGTQFYAQSYTGDDGGGEARPHGHYEWHEERFQDDGDDYYQAQVYGFTDAEEVEIFQTWQAI